MVAGQARMEELVEPTTSFQGIPAEGLGCGLEVVDLGEDPSPDLVRVEASCTVRSLRQWRLPLRCRDSAPAELKPARYA